MKNRTKHISKCVNTLMRYIMMREDIKSINEMLTLSYNEYAKSYPTREDQWSAPKQNPLVYLKVRVTTSAWAINIRADISQSIESLPDHTESPMSRYDRVIVHYQNTRDYDIPAWIRVPWLDIEYTQWEKYTPSLLV